MTSTNIPGLETFIHAMIALAISIGLLVIFLTMYTTVIERTRDIGVLKSIGANRAFIVRALLTESAALCVFGIAAGIGLSYAVRAAFLAGFPTLSQNTARVSSSISFSIASGASDAAKRTAMPWLGRT